MIEIARQAQGWEDSNVLAIGELHGFPQIAAFVAQLDLRQGGSFNISYDPVSEQAQAVWISPKLQAGRVVSVPPSETFVLADLVVGCGKNIFGRTERLSISLPSPAVTVRFVAAQSEGGYTFSCRVNVFREFSLTSLVPGTLPGILAETLVQAMLFSPACRLVICGPGGSGKSTLLNAITTEMTNRAPVGGRHSPSIAVYNGDAFDVIVPSGTTFLSRVSGDSASTLIKSCNSRVFIIGEVVREETCRLFQEANTAASHLATTTHGNIQQALAKVPADMCVQMQVLGQKYVVSKAVADLSVVASGIAAELSEESLVRYVTPEGERTFWVLCWYNEVKRMFYHTPALERLLAYLKSMQEQYFV